MELLRHFEKDGAGKRPRTSNLTLDSSFVFHHGESNPGHQQTAGGVQRRGLRDVAVAADRGCWDAGECPHKMQALAVLSNVKPSNVNAIVNRG